MAFSARRTAKKASFRYLSLADVVAIKLNTNARKYGEIVRSEWCNSCFFLNSGLENALYTMNEIKIRKTIIELKIAARA